MGHLAGGSTMNPSLVSRGVDEGTGRIRHVILEPDLSLPQSSRPGCHTSGPQGHPGGDHTGRHRKGTEVRGAHAHHACGKSLFHTCLLPPGGRAHGRPDVPTPTAPQHVELGVKRTQNPRGRRAEPPCGTWDRRRWPPGERGQVWGVGVRCQVLQISFLKMDASMENTAHRVGRSTRLTPEGLQGCREELRQKVAGSASAGPGG